VKSEPGSLLAQKKSFAGNVHVLLSSLIREEKEAGRANAIRGVAKPSFFAWQSPGQMQLSKAMASGGLKVVFIGLH